MKLLVTEANIIAPGSPYHGKTCDLLVDNGTITTISSKRLAAPKGFKTYNAKGKFLSPGWVDMLTHVPDPGFEFKESVHSACAAAAAGGFTAIAVTPETHPPVHSKSEVKYLLKQANSLAVDVLPMGAVSHQLAGKELAEMFDMQQAGAVAFTDGDKPIAHAGVMLRALLYAKGINALVLARPEQKEIAGNAMVHESKNTTLLGLKGIPSIAEDVMVARDIELIRYTGGKLHFSKISSASSVELIRRAKKEKLNITCDVSVNNLVFTDAHLADYDTNLKLTPPLRSESDRKALLKGLKDGVIDAIVSDHNPQDTESKAVEFDYSAYGAIGLQTVYAALNTYLGNELPAELLVEKLAVNPRNILGLQQVEIKENTPANFTLFDAKQKWIYNEKNNLSKSANSCLLQKELTGKVTAIYNNNQWIVTN
ncbi:MAG: dihydroorotase [Bacteroidia bacterium]|nr:dihydroorotase [Bacteroidia bacterium]